MLFGVRFRQSEKRQCQKYPDPHTLKPCVNVCMQIDAKTYMSGAPTFFHGDDACFAMIFDLANGGYTERGYAKPKYKKVCSRRPPTPPTQGRYRCGRGRAAVPFFSAAITESWQQQRVTHRAGGVPRVANAATAPNIHQSHV